MQESSASNAESARDDSALDESARDTLSTGLSSGQPTASYSTEWSSVMFDSDEEEQSGLRGRPSHNLKSGSPNAAADPDLYSRTCKEPPQSDSFSTIEEDFYPAALEANMRLF